MGGLTTGARQFTLMAPQSYKKFGEDKATNFTQIDPTGIYLYQEKLDLRALLEGGDSGRGLDFVNIALQEHFPWVQATWFDTGAFVLDVVTTVRPSHEAMLNHVSGGNGLGFLPDITASTDHQVLNPSQVLWGLWRKLQPSKDAIDALTVVSSSNFGEGEIAVSPHLWYSRVFAIDSQASLWVPAANLVCNARMVKLNEPQEMGQMIRASGR